MTISAKRSNRSPRRRQRGLRTKPTSTAKTNSPKSPRGCRTWATWSRFPQNGGGRPRYSRLGPIPVGHSIPEIQIIGGDSVDDLVVENEPRRGRHARVACERHVFVDSLRDRRRLHLGVRLFGIKSQSRDLRATRLVPAGRTGRRAPSRSLRFRAERGPIPPGRPARTLAHGRSC